MYLDNKKLVNFSHARKFLIPNTQTHTQTSTTPTPTPMPSPIATFSPAPIQTQIQTPTPSSRENDFGIQEGVFATAGIPPLTPPPFSPAEDDPFLMDLVSPKASQSPSPPPHLGAPNNNSQEINTHHKLPKTNQEWQFLIDTNKKIPPPIRFVGKSRGTFNPPGLGNPCYLFLPKNNWWIKGVVREFKEKNGSYSFFFNNWLNFIWVDGDNFLCARPIFFDPDYKKHILRIR